jgi:hypothetical protein
VRIIAGCVYVRLNTMGAVQLSEQLKRLSEAIRAVEATLEEMRSAHDELAAHILVARRDYQRSPGSKDGKNASGDKRSAVTRRPATWAFRATSASGRD